jgi:hypothetical protein
MNDHFEDRLRDSLRGHAVQAPDDFPVVQRVLRDVAARPPVQSPARWRAWLVPLVAAGAVAAVAGTVVGVQNFRPSHHAIAPGISNSPTALASTPSEQPPSQSIASTPVSTTGPAPADGLHGYRIGDLTFVGDRSWALASADCLSPIGCPFAVATSVKGGTWKLVAGPTLEWGGHGPLHIRFATDETGYLYGGSALFVTRDAGTSWKQQPIDKGTQVLAVETLDDNVIRVQTRCLPGCPVTVWTAAIGSDQWTQRTLPGDQPSMTTRADLIRVKGTSYLNVYGNPAGGAGQATSRMFVSTDGGATWVNKGEPCVIGGGGVEFDSTAIASGGGVLVALCTPRGSERSYVLSSTDGGYSWRRGQGVDASAGGPLAVSGDTILLDATDGLYRSTDAGNTWQRVNEPDLGRARWLGFESETDARVVNTAGDTIWTTHDAGGTWTPTPFP